MATLAWLVADGESLKLPTIVPAAIDFLARSPTLTGRKMALRALLWLIDHGAWLSGTTMAYVPRSRWWEGIPHRNLRLSPFALLFSYPAERIGHKSVVVAIKSGNIKFARALITYGASTESYIHLRRRIYPIKLAEFAFGPGALIASDEENLTLLDEEASSEYGYYSSEEEYFND